MSAAEGKPLAPCAVTIQGWFDWWFHDALRGEIQIGWRDASTGALNRFKNFELGDDGIGEFIAAINAVPGQSVYFRASTVKAGTEAAATDGDFEQAPGVWGDLDDEGGWQRASGVETLLRPCAWVETGKHPHWRAQPFWRFDEPCNAPERVAALNRRVVALYGSDPAVTNPTRLMRVPGTIAWPAKPGRVPELTNLVLPRASTVYSVEFLERSLPREEAAKAEAPQPTPEAPSGAGLLRVSNLLAAARQPGQWHNNTLRLVAHWVGRGWATKEILATAEHLTLEGFTVQQTRRELAKMIESARNKWGVDDTDHAIGAAEPAAPFSGPIMNPWDAMSPVAFPMDALPPALAAFAGARAAAIGCDPAAVAMAALSALSAALDGRSRLRLKRHDKWSVPPALWVALVGASSAKKSPAIRAAWQPLEALQAVKLREYALRMAAWDAQPKDQKGDKPPPPTRFVTHDATVEAVQGILANQSRGLGVLRDELAGFIGQMDKYSGGKGGAADRAFFLQSFEGGAYVADRVGRGTVPVENLLLAICGGIQPDRLTSLGDLTEDGLWQRFLPVIMAPPTMGRDVPSGEAEGAYEAIVDHVLRLPTLAATLTHEARIEREAAERRLFELEQADALGGAFTSYLGKLSGVWGRLALVIHAADQQAIPGEVTGTHARAASRLVFDYLIPSGARVYVAMGAPGVGTAQPMRDAAGYILSKRLDRVLSSDLTRNVRSCRKLGVGDVQRVVSPLVAGGWLTPERDTPTNSSWMVNPRVHERFAQRAELERNRREAVRAIIAEKDDEE